MKTAAVKDYPVQYLLTLEKTICNHEQCLFSKSYGPLGTTTLS